MPYMNHPVKINLLKMLQDSIIKMSNRLFGKLGNIIRSTPATNLSVVKIRLVLLTNGQWSMYKFEERLPPLIYEWFFTENSAYHQRAFVSALGHLVTLIVFD